MIGHDERRESHLPFLNVQEWYASWSTSQHLHPCGNPKTRLALPFSRRHGAATASRATAEQGKKSAAKAVRRVARSPRSRLEAGTRHGHRHRSRSPRSRESSQTRPQPASLCNDCPSRNRGPIGSRVLSNADAHATRSRRQSCPPARSSRAKGNAVALHVLFNAGAYATTPGSPFPDTPVLHAGFNVAGVHHFGCRGILHTARQHYARAVKVPPICAHATAFSRDLSSVKMDPKCTGSYTQDRKSVV